MNQEVVSFFNKSANTLANLKFRWRGERDYEDFNEYVKVIKNLMPKGFTFVKLTKTFCLSFDHKGIRYEMKIARGQASLYRPDGHSLTWR